LPIPYISWSKITTMFPISTIHVLCYEGRLMVLEDMYSVDDYLITINYNHDVVPRICAKIFKGPVN